MTKPTLSVVTTVSDAVSKEYYLKELIESVYDIADEIIVVNGDKWPGLIPWKSETDKLISSIKAQYASDMKNFIKIKVFHNDWEPRMGCMMGRLQRSLAISHATSDYVMLLDADEVLFEQDHDKVRKCMDIGHIAYAWRTVHFYKDYNTIKIPGDGWYNYRFNLFKNNSYVYDMHSQDNGYQGTVYYNNAEQEKDRKCYSLASHPDAKLTSIRAAHVGHVRSKKVYIKKTNDINRSYHPDRENININNFAWDMLQTEKYNGDYPKALLSRMKAFNNV